MSCWAINTGWLARMGGNHCLGFTAGHQSGGGKHLHCASLPLYMLLLLLLLLLLSLVLFLSCPVKQSLSQPTMFYFLLQRKLALFSGSQCQEKRQCLWAQDETKDIPFSYSVGDGTIYQIAHGGGGVFLLGDLHRPSGHGLWQPALGAPAWAGELDKMTLMSLQLFCNSLILYFERNVKIYILTELLEKKINALNEKFTFIFLSQILFRK